MYRIVLVVLVSLGLGSSQIPRYEFAWNASDCCCHHAGPCPCPGHHPGHDRSPTMRSCGSGGHEVVSPAAPVVDLAPIAVAIAPPVTRVTHDPVAGPHGAPVRERPCAPS